MAYYNNKPAGYVGAPYNFVPFTQKVVPYSEENDQEKAIPAHNAVSEELLSGEISYKIEAKTPIIIDDGNGEFWKNAYGVPAIPGSSVRGLIRANAQVLSLSSMADDVDDYSLMFRNVASGPKKMKEHYGTILGAGTININNGKESQQISVLKKVRAGYLINENGTYRIYDTNIDRIEINREDPEGDVLNYYILSERKLSGEYLASRNSRQPFAYPFFLKKDGNRTVFKTQNLLDKGFEKRQRGSSIQYVGVMNRSYVPYAEPCSYEVKGRDITAVAAPGVLSKNGYAVSTGNMHMKKAIYIIPEIDKNKVRRFEGDKYELPLTIPEADVQSFKVDINKRDTTLKQFGGRKCFDLPEEGKMRPVFYIYDGGHLYFGFTARLRLFYDHTIKDGMPADHKKDLIDYAKAIFGYADSEKSRKSRVSFSDATVEGVAKSMEQQMEIQAEPKPTSYLDYVIPKRGEGMSYNDNGFQLRGMKQYWLRDETYCNVPTGKENEKYVSKFRPLPEGTVFTGKVRFHNLKKEELGLLIWSMKLNGNSWMNIGKAKSFGFGNMMLTVESVKQLDTEKAYDMSSLVLDPYTVCDADAMIEAYKTDMSARLGGQDIEKLDTIEDFFLMKNPECMPDKGKIRFMSIDQREYQNRTVPLQTVKEVLGLKTVGKKVQGTNQSSGGYRSGNNNAETVTYEMKPKEPEYKAVDQSTVVEKGKSYKAVVTGDQGKKLKFKVDAGTQTIHGTIDCTDIKCKTVTKAMLKGLKNHSLTVLCKEYKEGGKAVWECTDIEL